MLQWAFIIGNKQLLTKTQQFQHLYIWLRNASKQSSPDNPQLPSEIAAAGFKLFKERYQWYRHVRALCVRAINLVPKDSGEQMSMFDDNTKRLRRECVEDAVESIRSRFGRKAITYTDLLGDLKTPTDGRDKVRMPGLMYR